MQELEKNNSHSFFETPDVNRRIVARYMRQHRQHQAALNAMFSQSDITPLEAAGTAGYIALFNEEQGYAYVRDSIQDTILLLSVAQVPPGSEAFASKITTCMEIQSRLLQLFTWLEAYGPEKD